MILWRLVRALLLSAALFVGSVNAQGDSKAAQTNVDQATHSVDYQGIPTLSIDGVGAVSHPAWTALYALAYAGIEDYDPSLSLKPDATRFQATIDWLKNNLVQDRNGLWVWVYNFDSTYNDVSIKAPWSSAFAQATGIQALLAHWKQTGDEQSLEFARKAAQALFVPLEQGGFLFRSGDDIWFEEIPEPVNNPSHILNGHMRALLALGELVDATGDEQYREWFKRGSDTLLRWLPLYDAGYWLRYDLNPRKEELLFRLANPYGFANPELAIDRIALRDPLTGDESVLDVGGASDAEGALRIAGNDWGQIEQLEGRSVRRLRAVEGEREAVGSEGQMVAPFSYFYLKLPGQWGDNLREAPYELTVEYYDDKPANLEVQLRSIAPGHEAFKKLKDGDLLISGKGTWRQWKINLSSSDLGYWVGMTYANKHKQYLNLLARKDSRLEVWEESATAYAKALVANEEFEIVQPEDQVLPEQTPVLPIYSLDENGVVRMHMPRPGSDDADKIGTPVYSPYIIATQAIDGSNMAGLDDFLSPLGIDRAKVNSAPALEWLLDRDNQSRVSGAILYPFTFDNTYNDVVTKASWSSAFAQNYVLKALGHAYKVASDDRDDIEDTLIGVLRSYEVDVSQGGVVSADKAGGYFFEEVPNRTHVFNAQVSSIPMLFEANSLVGGAADETIAKGLASLRRNAYLFDTGYWLRYDLNPKKELLFQLDWLSGDSSPLVEYIYLEAPQFSKKNQLYVGGEQAFEGGTRISGLEWQPVQQVDGKQVRAFANGYLSHETAVKGGTRHNVYAVMQLPETKFPDYFDVQPHRLVVRYKDVAAGQFVVKLQSINEGNVLDFVPLRNSVITMTGDQQWKEAVVGVRPQDMGWYKGADYQIFEIEQLEQIAALTGDWFFSQYAERQRYYLSAKGKGVSVIVEPSFRHSLEAVRLSLVDASSTYDGYGFENSLDGDPNDDYVASIENIPQSFVVLALDRPFRKGVLKIQWESRSNYARDIRVLSAGSDGARELTRVEVADGGGLEIGLNSATDVDALRLEFAEFVGQPRLLIRYIDLKVDNSDAQALGQGQSSVPKQDYLNAVDVRNPLSVFRIPVSQEVKKISDEISQGIDSDEEKIRAFMKLIGGFEVGVASDVSPDATIKERRGACGSFTNTLLALAAAQGLEGRVVSLLNYPEGDGHAVAEIKLNGRWALFDPTYGAFYTRGDSEVPLSFQEIRSSYLAGDEVRAQIFSPRPGMERYVGRDIFVEARPAGVIGADKPFIFPLKFNVSQRNSLEASEFGPDWQGADFIGAASTNKQQDWLFENLDVGGRYRFVISAEGVRGDISVEDRRFKLLAIVGGMGEGELVHEFDFSQNGVQSWSIPFRAASTTQKISLRHDYLGPQYRYLAMHRYQLVKED